VASVLKDWERAQRKYAQASSGTDDALDELLAVLREHRDRIDASGSQDGVKDALLERLKEGNFKERVKDASHAAYNAVSKVGKKMDELVHPDISAACRGVDMDKVSLNRVIAEHFFREARFRVGETFSQEAGVQDYESLRKPFQELHVILSELDRRNVQPALKWAQTNQKGMGGEGHLEFMLHRLHFLHLLEHQGRAAAIVYAREVFGPFAVRHLEDIQQLMGLVLWTGSLDRAPRRDLLSKRMWQAAAEEVARQSCALLGQAAESPLLVSVAAGATVLPMLLKVSKMKGGAIDFQTCQQLPVELELGREYYFHSIFACPVSKDQSTKDNPPMALPCGHVLSKESIQSIAKKERIRPFKCPYCPHECKFTDCREIIFPQVEAEQLLQMRNHLHLSETAFSASAAKSS